jgi:hypothetical protein
MDCERHPAAESANAGLASDATVRTAAERNFIVSRFVSKRDFECQGRLNSGYHQLNLIPNSRYPSVSYTISSLLADFGVTPLSLLNEMRPSPSGPRKSPLHPTSPILHLNNCLNPSSRSSSGTGAPALSHLKHLSPKDSVTYSTF